MLSAVLFFNSCGLKSMISDYNFIKTDLEKVELNRLGNEIILIYNEADILHKISNPNRLKNI
jgi:hypothetical protein